MFTFLISVLAISLFTSWIVKWYKGKYTVIQCYLDEDDKYWLAKTLNGEQYRFSINKWYNNTTGEIVSYIDNDKLTKKLDGSVIVAKWNHNFWRHPKYLNKLKSNGTKRLTDNIG